MAAQFGLLQVEHSGAPLQGHGDGVYPLFDPFLAHGLGTENPAVFGREDQLDRDWLGAGVVVGMMARVEVYLLVLRQLAADPPALQRLLAGAGGGHGDVEHPADSGSLNAAEPGVAA
jgi:hypothetical protein